MRKSDSIPTVRTSTLGRIGPRAAAAAALTAALLVSALAPAVALAEPPDPPPYYAIRGATVVTGAGETIEGGTVLLADGLIEAVGTGIEIPADAWVIEGDGLFLYPGLIDALTDLGQKSDESEGGGGPPGRGGPPPAQGPEDRPKTTPWVSAADLQGEDGRLEKWRQAGFGATASAPTQGIFSGQAALVHLGTGDPEERVIATPVAQRLSFDRGGFVSYPGSLMGVIAYVKQVLLDARHYGEVQALYAASPAGRERPAYDRALEPIEAALDAGLPFLVPADLAREIDRALALHRDYDLPAVIYGGGGAYARAEQLAQAGLPVLLSLDFPEAEKDRDPEADTPLPTLYHRRMAPGAAAALAAAGVPFAFYSGGLASPAEIFESVRAAIDAGLSEEDALAALSAGAADIYGVADRLGTIEAGKIANLVLATAAPWAADAEVRAVFVDGRKYQERQSEEPSEPPASDVSGTWELTLTTPGGARQRTAELEMSEDGEVTGRVSGDEGDSTLEDGRMSADLLRFKTTRSGGGRTMTASWSLTVEGERLSGSISAGPMSIDVSGERTAAPEQNGEEGGEEAADEEPAVSNEELRAAMAAYRGPVRRMGSFAITNATVWTVSGETLDGGTVVIEDGKIAAVGRDVAIPEGLEVIDAGGGALIPGIMDAHSHIAIEGGGNEGAPAVTSMVAIGDVLDPDDIAIYRALAGGVTTANILHGSANPIGGQNQLIKLRWGADAEGLKLAGAPPGIKFALGENPKRSNFRSFNIPQRYPQTRMGVIDVIRTAFAEARDYQRTWADYERARSAGEQPLPPRRDLRLEALVEILEGERWVHSHCYRADEILQLLRLAEEFGFRIATLQHVLEGYKVADEIAAHGAGASTFSDWWGYKVEAYDAIPHNAALMAERDVLVTINSDSGEEMRHLNQEAAKAIKWGGAGEIEALRMVTLNAAKQFGIDDRVGSIEVGKDADLVLYDGHPLRVSSVVQKTFVDGDLYFDREADRERQAKIEAIKEKLRGDEDDEDEEEEAAEAEDAVAGAELEGEAAGTASAEASGLPAAAVTGGPLVLEGGTVHPVTSEPFVGRVVIDGGRIVAAGPDAAAPAGAKVIDAAGRHVYPGLMDAMSQLGLVEVNAVPATDDLAEMGVYNPHLTAATAIHPASELIPVARANGITHSLVAPETDDDGVIPGQAALVQLDGWTVEEMAIDPRRAMVIEWPRIVTGRFDFSTFSFVESPFQEAKEKAEKAQNELRDWLDAARHYAKAAAADEVRADRDLKLEALARVVRGEQRVIVLAHDERDIEQAVAFAEEQEIDIVLAGGREAWKLKEMLADKEIPVILGIVQSLPEDDDDPYDEPFRNAGELAAAGIRIAFASGAGGGFGPGGPHGSRTLPYEAATAAAYGLAREDALAALTLWPAEMLGVGDLLGSIEPGKIANLIVTDGDPLEITTRVEHLIIGGREVSTDNKHRRLYERYRGR